MSFKPLHTFSVTIDKETEEITTSHTPDGKEVTTKGKVVKPVQITIALKEPTRSEKREVQLFQATTYNKAVEIGLLPKMMMTQRLSKNPESALLMDEDKSLAATTARLQELANDYMRIGSNPKTPEDTAIKQRLELEWQTLKKKEVDITSAYQSVFAHTAEQYAQNQVLMWLTLYLTYLKVGPERYEPLFLGPDFAAKETKLDEMEDSGDKIYLACVQELSSSWMLWYFGHASKHDEFVTIKERWKKEAVDAQKAREEAEAEVAKEAEPTQVTEPVVDPAPPPEATTDGSTPAS